MSNTDVAICNAALIMVGADDINSFSDDTVESKLCRSVYTTTKQALLQRHPWRFSLKQADLGGALVSEPLFKWNYKYQLPPDLLRVIALEQEEEYEVFDRNIYTNASPCKIIYQVNVSESTMPAYFIKCLHHELAKLFSMALQEDEGKMQLFERAADKEVARARSIDSQQQPNMKIPERNFTLLNIRG